MSTFSNILEAKLSSKYQCQLCDYSTCKKSNFEKHCESNRHKNKEKSTNSNFLEAKLSSKKYSCDNCKKTFKERSGLWRHNKKCNFEDTQYIDGVNIKDTNALVLHLLKQNGELQNKLIELSTDKSITNNTNTNSFNTTNNAFNMNFFLNETCKDAMNISDFVSSIKLNIEDLETTGRQGYIEGISKIIIKNLNN